MVSFIKPKLPKIEEISEELNEILQTGQVTTGKYMKLAEEAIKNLWSTEALMVSSCSSGLNLLLSTLPKGTEVLIPTYGFIATYEAVKWNGLTPVLVDVNENGLIDEDEVENAISSKTSAVLGVHVYGSSAFNRRLDKLCKDAQIKLFFDAAHALGSQYDEKPIAQYGDANVFSLGPTKTLPNGGEGGLICTKDKELIELLKWKRQHGHKGDLDSFTFGTNSRPSEILSMIFWKNLNNLNSEIKRRHELHKIYSENLKFDYLPRFTNLDKPSVNYFVILHRYRDMFMNWLWDKFQMPTKRYFHPSLNKVKLISENQKFHNSEILASQALAIPFHTSLTDEEALDICQKANQYLIK